jgi:hypothetical protein
MISLQVSACGHLVGCAQALNERDTPKRLAALSPLDRGNFHARSPIDH